MKPLCDMCGTRHESYQAHVFATNRIATNAHATNKEANEHVSLAPHDCGKADGVAGVGKRTRNRRSREVYNAYQREYMRKRRLKV